MSYYSYAGIHLMFFEKGKYLPLELKGKYKDKVIAFARQHKNNWVILIAPMQMPAVKKK